MTVEGFDDAGNAVPLPELKMSHRMSMDGFTKEALAREAEALERDAATEEADAAEAEDIDATIESANVVSIERGKGGGSVSGTFGFSKSQTLGSKLDDSADRTSDVTQLLPSARFDVHSSEAKGCRPPNM